MSTESDILINVRLVREKLKSDVAAVKSEMKKISEVRTAAANPGMDPKSAQYKSDTQAFQQYLAQKRALQQQQYRQDSADFKQYLAEKRAEEKKTWTPIQTATPMAEGFGIKRTAATR